MVRGNLKSRSKIRYDVRVPSGVSVRKYRAKKPGKPTSPSGMQLPGTQAASKVQTAKLTKTERRPSRPYGGVLSSPELRQVMHERVQARFSPETHGKTIQVGSVCMKIAGRDAGKLCVITEIIDNHFVKAEGHTRPRKVNVKHLEPVGKIVDAKAKDLKTLLA